MGFGPQHRRHGLPPEIYHMKTFMALAERVRDENPDITTIYVAADKFSIKDAAEYSSRWDFVFNSNADGGASKKRTAEPEVGIECARPACVQHNTRVHIRLLFQGASTAYESDKRYLPPAWQVLSRGSAYTRDVARHRSHACRLGCGPQNF